MHALKYNRPIQKGLTLMINGVLVTLRVTLVAFLADTLAAHQLGGFKIGVGWSFCKCHDCLATSRDIQSKVLTSGLGQGIQDCFEGNVIFSTCSSLKRSLLYGTHRAMTIIVI